MGRRARSRSCSTTRSNRSRSRIASASTTRGRSSITSSRSTRTRPRRRFSWPRAAARTKNIRLGHGIRQVIPQYNHPARTAEVIATLDLVSNGRVDFGTGESSAVLELGGFGITVEEKRKIYLESTEQICNILAMDPYPGYVGKYFDDAVPKPGAETGAAAASAGVGGVFAARNDPHGGASRHRCADVRVRRSAGGEFLGRGVLQHHQERRMCPDRPQRSTRTSAWCRASHATPTATSAIERGLKGFEFFGYALGSLYGFGAHKPGRTNLWKEFETVFERAGSRCRRRSVRRSSGGARRHRYTGRSARSPAQVRNRRCRPGDVHSAGRHEQARAHL